MPLQAQNGPDDEQAIVVEMRNTSTLAELIAQLKQERVVYVGESHTQYGDHLMQLAVIKGLYRQAPNLAIGVEWFQKPDQKHLDGFIAGKINEAELLRRSDYFNTWRFDYRLYRPIMRFAAANKIPLIALNAPAELTNAIRESGIEGLNKALKKQLPNDYDFSDKVYEKQLKKIFAMHPDKEKKGDFQRFLEVQLTWDESMAQQAADYLNKNPQHRMVVLAGRGHLSSRFGIPNRLERRTRLKGKLILVGQQGISEKGAADYVLFAKHQQLPPTGLMGALLNTDGKEGVEITGFSKESAVEKAGVKKGDLIVSIDDAPIKNYVDLKLVMLDRAPGDEIKLVIERKWKNRTFKIKLQAGFMH